MAPSRKPQPLGIEDDFWVLAAINPALTAVGGAVERFVIEMKWAQPGPVSNTAQPTGTPAAGPARLVKSGQFWVDWADQNAMNSQDVEDLADSFKPQVKEFIKALEDAGATVKIDATRRAAKRAYLFHWSWLIALGKVKASAATPLAGVDIQWDHGDRAASKAGAQEMVSGFGLAVPPNSKVAPALRSNHIAGLAIDMKIHWTGSLNLKNKNGTFAQVPFMADANANTKLHAVGATYGVKKHTSDAPHWSIDGK